MSDQELEAMLLQMEETWTMQKALDCVCEECQYGWQSETIRQAPA